MYDPRAENCRGFRLDAAGKVAGVELVYAPVPSAPYELVRVELIDEAAAQGNTVATCVVLDKNGIQTAATVYLGWPWPVVREFAPPGNPNGQHMITSTYQPPALGPLALYVGNGRGEPLSDAVGGLGLPDNRHVSFRATWMERAAPTEPEPDEEPDPEPDGDGVLVAPGLECELGRIADALEALCRHFGVGV